MKKTFTYVLIALAARSFAQSPAHFTFIPSPGYENLNRDIDTVPMPDLFPDCYDNLVAGMLVFGPDHISGTNSHHDQEKAQFFAYAGGGNINKVHVAIGIKADHSSNTPFVLNLYTAGTMGPDVLLGTSLPLTYADIHTASGDYTGFTFSPAVAVPDSFYVSAVVSSGDPDEDEIVLVTLVDGSNVHNTCGKNTAWEKQADDGWYLMSDPIDSWGVDLAFLMLPEIDNAFAGTGERSSLTALNVYPNPATGTVNFACTFEGITGALLTVTDITGKTMYTAKLPAGNGHVVNHKMDLHTFAPGIYGYSIKTDAGLHTGKFVVE